MAGIDEAFWDQLDARIAATIVRAPHRRRSRTPAPRARISLPPVEEEAVADRHVVSDWTGLVETISAAGAAAQQQDTRLRGRSPGRGEVAGDPGPGRSADQGDPGPGGCPGPARGRAGPGGRPARGRGGGLAVELRGSEPGPPPRPADADRPGVLTDGATPPRSAAAAPRSDRRDRCSRVSMDGRRRRSGRPDPRPPA